MIFFSFPPKKKMVRCHDCNKHVTHGIWRVCGHCERNFCSDCLEAGCDGCSDFFCNECQAVGLFDCSLCLQVNCADCGSQCAKCGVHRCNGCLTGNYRWCFACSRVTCRICKRRTFRVTCNDQEALCTPCKGVARRMLAAFSERAPFAGKDGDRSVRIRILSFLL